MTKKRRKPRNYINNGDFLDALREYRKICQQAEIDGKERPSIPNYLALCVQKIAFNLSKKKNFAGYPFLEDMVGDAIENGIQIINRDTFDINKENPFAYFTQALKFAFIRRIIKEKDELYGKTKIAQHIMTSVDIQHEQGVVESLQNIIETDNNIVFMEKMEDYKERKRNANTAYRNSRR